MQLSWAIVDSSGMFSLILCGHIAPNQNYISVTAAIEESYFKTTYDLINNLVISQTPFTKRRDKQYCLVKKCNCRRKTTVFLCCNADKYCFCGQATLSAFLPLLDKRQTEEKANVALVSRRIWICSKGTQQLFGFLGRIF